MTIDHLAIWVSDLEKMKAFYERYFQCLSGDKYFNPTKNFESYFLSFSNGCRLELMQMPGIPPSENDPQKQFSGIIHFAIKVGTVENVNSLTETLRTDGYAIVGEPRRTGDGYYESVVLDPENNRLEIMA
jgi:lactoylglutathione lyase